MFFAYAADVEHVFGHYEGHVDVGAVKYLHYFLDLPVIPEDVYWALFESFVNQGYEHVFGFFVESASAMGASVSGFDDEYVGIKYWGFVDSEVAGEDHALVFFVFDHYLGCAEDVVGFVESYTFV